MTCKTVLVVIHIRKDNNRQQSCCFAELVLRSPVGLCVERRSKLSVNKNDLNTDFPKHPDIHTHTHKHARTHTHSLQECELNNGRRGGMLAGGACILDEIFS